MIRRIRARIRDVQLRNLALTPGLAAAGGVLFAVALNSHLDLSYAPKQLPSPPSYLSEPGVSLAPPSRLSEPATPPLRALPLRMIDEGGVGIPVDEQSWGDDYSHHTLAFEQMVLPQAPWLDAAAFARIEQDWIRHLDRSSGYGYNAISLRRFLELVNFDELEDGRRVYAADDPARAQRLAVRGAFRRLLQLAAQRGMAGYLYTDMAALNSALEFYLRREAGLDARRSEFWRPYRAALTEIFLTMPEVEGVIIRVGEAGAVYNAPGVDYRSELLVRDAESLRLMLRELLPVFEEHGKTLIFRTWTVGIGEIGDLHTNPQTYKKALAGVNSPNLIVATKYCMGDYDSFLPLNPTLFQGEHRRIIEFQARREYEGFGALPNYMGPLHQYALQKIVAANPQVEGAWVWSQTGGPLRAGPLNLYPLRGLWRWIDLNVYHLGELLQRPDLDSRIALRRWLDSWPSLSPSDRRILTPMLLASHELIDMGLYIEPAARMEVRAMGLEPPPMLWLWGFVGGSSAELATAYELSKYELARTIENPYQAAAVFRRFSALLREAPSAADPERDLAIDSLDYAADLFETLGAYQRFFLRYHRWLEHGGELNRADWNRDLDEFRRRLERHRRLYSDNLDFPAFDFFAAEIGAELMLRSPDMAWLARGLLALGLLLLFFFLALWRRENPFGRWKVRIMAACLALFTISAALVCSSFASLQFLLLSAVPAILLGGGYALSLRDGYGRSVHAVAALWRFIPLLLVCVAPITLRGPAHFWHLFWLSETFRIIWAILYAGTFLWMSVMLALDSGVRAGRPRRHVAGGVCTGLGLSLVWCGGVFLVQGFESSLARLVDETAILPLLLSRVLGIVTHLNLPESAPVAMLLGGVALLFLAGLLLRAPRSLRRGSAQQQVA